MKLSISKRGVASPIVALVAVAAFSGVASAAPSASFLTFGDEGGIATINGGTITLDNSAGGYSGVYVKSKSLNNKPLADVHVSFKSTGDVAGGAPRFSIPLSTGTNVYAFLDVNNCGTDVVSTDDDTCQVHVNTGGSYANWDAFAAANPLTRVSKTAIPFIIADQLGTYLISDVDIR
jgi:hypothetical protein